MAEAIFGGDLIEVVAKFLDPVDIWHLASIKMKKKKRLFKWFKLSIIRKIDQWFRDYFQENYQEFRNIMMKSDIVVGGSFVLQMILGETWHGSDIDIFTQVKFNHHGNLNFIEFSEIENFLHRHHESPEPPRVCVRYTGVMDSRLKAIREYNICDKYPYKRFQVISLDASKIRKILYRQTDLTICKNMFSYTSDGPKISFIRPIDIFSKVCRTNIRLVDRDFCCKLARWKKYKSRGFALYNERIIEIIAMNHGKDRCNCYNPELLP